jgi:DNA-binding LacI/PurR family transcriptional regulator
MKKRAKRVSRNDVAKLAGVSTATVSYVLNNSPKIRGETRQHVLDAIKTLNYTPDPIARSMVTKKTMQLSIVLNNIANPIYSELIRGFEHKALEHGYFVNICTGEENVDAYFENFITRRIDGVFIEALPNKFHIDKVYALVDTGIKVIMFGHGGADVQRISSIETDYIAIMEKAVDFLTSLGHHRIAYISGLTRKQQYDYRIEGYQQAMEKREYTGIAQDLLLCNLRSSTTTIRDGQKLTEKLLARNKKFTAVICTNDLMAVGAMQALKAAKIRVPNDVSVIGIDNAGIGELVTPTLTTIAIPYRLLGRKAFELLYTDLQSDRKGFYQGSAKLLVRESTAHQISSCSPSSSIH